MQNNIYSFPFLIMTFLFTSRYINLQKATFCSYMGIDEDDSFKYPEDKIRVPYWK